MIATHDHWTLTIRFEIQTLQVLSKQRKHQMREVNTKQHTHTHTQKQPRKINKFELLFIRVMMTGSLILVL